MNHFASFNTGFKYKFCFGVQSSDDILLFGGTPTFVYEGDPKHEWTIRDKECIQKFLQNIERHFSLEAFPFEDYEKSLDGTYKVASRIHDLTFPNENMRCKYLLACILYHQLLYKQNLYCLYSTSSF